MAQRNGICGVVIYATEESCEIMQRNFERMRNDLPIQDNRETGFSQTDCF